MNDQNDFIVQLQKEFLDEVTFLLEQCEESYLKLENPAHRSEELSTIFRVAHSIKGSGAVVGFDDLAGFAHVVEDCLTVLRSNTDLVNPEVISLLLQAGDAFKTRVAMLKVKSTDPWDIDSLKAQIVKATETLKSGGTAPKAQSSAAPVVEESKPVEEVTAPVATGAAQAAPERAASTEHPAEQSVQDHQADQHVHEAPRHDIHRKQHHDDHGASSKGQQSVSVKVDSIRIDAVLDLVGELVVIKSQLLQEYARTERANLRQNEVLSLLDKTVRELQDKTLSMRMTSLKPTFLKVQRTVRDLAIKLNKPVEFIMSGEDIEIDRTMIELLNDPLIHIVRNALDHGLEKADVRKTRGKSEKGMISMLAKHAGGRIIVEIRDDGGGISREKVKNKAIKQGLIKDTQ